MMAGIFSWGINNCSLFDPTSLVLTVGTPHHGLKVGFWVSWLEISPE